MQLRRAYSLDVGSNPVSESSDTTLRAVTSLADGPRVKFRVEIVLFAMVMKVFAAKFEPEISTSYCPCGNGLEARPEAFVISVMEGRRPKWEVISLPADSSFAWRPTSGTIMYGGTTL